MGPLIPQSLNPSSSDLDMYDSVIFHSHNGVDSPRLKSGDIIQVLSSVPTVVMKEGTVVMVDDGTNRRLYAVMNGVWRATSMNGVSFYNDVNLGSMQLAVGANVPDLVTLNNSLLLRGFDGTAVTEQLYGVIEIPHDYLEGTDIVPHIHWCPSSTASGNVKWQLEYSWANPSDNATFPSSTTISVVSAAPGVTNQNTVSAFSAVSGTGKKISSHFVFRLFRNPADGSDTYGADALLVMIGLHYLSDGQGSIQATTKN